MISCMLLIFFMSHDVSVSVILWRVFESCVSLLSIANAAALCYVCFISAINQLLSVDLEFRGYLQEISYYCMNTRDMTIFDDGLINDT